MRSTPSFVRRTLLACVVLLVAALHGGTTPAEVAEFEAIKAKAIKGDAAAEAEMAGRILTGKGVDPTPDNVKEALRLLRSSADKGDSEGQFGLGDVLMHGMGRSAEAIDWWRKAAEQGHVGAQFNLGNAYRLGRAGGLPDAAEAAKWYRMAAEQGHPYAQFSLALALANGDGVKKDLAEAISWYRKSAEGGADKAQFNLGVAYWNGRGVPQDFAEAAKWYRMAAEQGMHQAQLCLAECIVKGYGQPADTIEACAWLTLAQRRNPAARETLQMLVSQSDLTPDQLEKVRTRARELDAEIAARPASRAWSR